MIAGFAVAGNADIAAQTGCAWAKERNLNFILWIAAVVLVIVGIVQLLQGQIILGIILIVVGLLVGPGGYSIFRR